MTDDDVTMPFYIILILCSTLGVELVRGYGASGFLGEPINSISHRSVKKISNDKNQMPAERYSSMSMVSKLKLKE